jgi:hypothetical protein
MDFRSRLATFPRGVPVHELNEDDYANNVKLSSTYGVERTWSKKRKQAFRYQVTFSSSDPGAMATPDNLNNQSKGKSAHRKNPELPSIVRMYCRTYLLNGP